MVPVQRHQAAGITDRISKRGGEFVLAEAGFRRISAQPVQKLVTAILPDGGAYVDGGLPV